MRSGNSHVSVTCPVRATSPVPRETWSALVKSDRRAVVSQSLAWHDCVCANPRVVDVSRLYEFGDDRQIILPVVRHDKVPLRLGTQSSWPRAWGVAGPITPNGLVTAEEARAVLSDVACCPALATEIHFRHGAEPGWIDEAQGFQVSDHTVHILDLDGGFAEVWDRRFHRVIRKNVRKAERSGLDIRVDREGRLLPVYLELLEASITKWAQRQHEPVTLARWRNRRTNAREKLDLVARHFGDACATWVAYWQGEPIASLIVLQFGVYAKSWKSALNADTAGPIKGANALLNRLAIEEACDAGLDLYDMGEARLGSSLAAFKAEFGAQSHTAYRIRTERLPVQTASDGTHRLAKWVLRFRDA
jgi:hypothetical protein